MRQIIEITLLNLRSIPSRLGSSLVIVVGVAGVVAVLVAILALGAGFESTLQRTGDADRVVILRAGANGELSSSLTIAQGRLIENMEGVASDGKGKLASHELYLIADVPKRANDSPANMPLRGVSERAFAVRPEVKIIAGRNLQPGRAELIAGRQAANQFKGMDIGNVVKLRDAQMEVVGIFEAAGGGYESEAWIDLAVAQDLFRGAGTLSSSRIRLTSPEAATTLQAAIDADPRFEGKAVSEVAYYSAQSEGLGSLIRSFGYAVAVIMAIGALFAALNTMYAAVSNRTIEIGTLRALGFGSGPVVSSVMIEALILSLAGGMLGGLIAYLGFNGNTVSTLNNVTFSQVSFDFAVTPALILQGILLACALGLIGGLAPALRAARLPVTVALRDG